MNRTVALHTVAVLVALAASAPAATRAQTPTDTSALRTDIERRFEVDRLRNGLALRPRDPSRAVRIIELTDGPVAVDGQPVTGAELRDKLGTADADLVMQLSYLSAADRQALFGTPTV